MVGSYVWKDGKVVSNRVDSVVWVFDLMVPGMKEWNMGLIDSIFNKEEALLIKCIPLASND